MTDNVTTIWSDGSIEKFSDAVFGTLFSLDEEMEKEGWDQPPLLGVVIGGELAGMGSLSVLCPEIPNEYLTNFQHGLAQISAKALTAELFDDESEQQFLNQLVSEGFQGWLAAAEFLEIPVDDEGNETGEGLERRIILFVDLENQKYVVSRKRGDAVAEKMLHQYPAVVGRSLSILTSASIMSLIRRDFLKKDDIE